MSRLISKGLFDFSVTACARLIVLVAGILFQALLAWYLQPEGRGAFAACQVFAIMLIACTSMGFYRGAAYHLATKEIAPQQAFSLFLSAWLVLSVFALALGLAAISLPLPFFEKAPRSVFVLAVFWGMGLHLLSGITSLLASMHRFGIRATICLVEDVLSLLLVFAFFTWFAATTQVAIVACLVGVSAVVVAVVLCLAFTKLLAASFPTRPQMRKITSYGSRFWIGDFTQTSDTYASLILVAMFVSNQELGYFAVAMAVFTQAKSVVDVFRTVIDPRAAAAEDGCVDTITLVARCLFIFACLGSILFAFVGHYVIALMFSPAFLPAMPVIYVLLLAAILECPTRITFSYFNGINRPGVVSILTSVRLALTLAFLVLLVPYQGLLGAAISVTCASVIYSVLLACWFWKLSGRHPLTLILPRTSDAQFVFKYLFKKPSEIQYTA